MYNSFQQGTSSNPDHQGMGECHVANPNDGNLAAWPQGYTLYPHHHQHQQHQHHHIQHDIVGTHHHHHHDMQDMMPHGQMNMPLPITASQLEPPKNESTDYDQNKQAQHHIHQQQQHHPHHSQ